MNPNKVLEHTAEIIREAALSGPVKISRETRAPDVRGWDSLSHTMILMGLEERFQISLPMERVMAAATVGDLVDLIMELKSNLNTVSS